MRDLDDGLTVLRIDDVADFKRRCPEQYAALIDGTAFVNFRQVEGGATPMLASLLSGWFTDPRLAEISPG